MPPEELVFEEFVIARMRDKGLTLKRLSEATGIAPVHLENMIHGNMDDMPSAPYFRGYVIRLGRVLEFNGEEWWEKIKRAHALPHSGPTDALPQNRFLKKKVSKMVWLWLVIGIALVAYLVFAIAHLVSRPSLAIIYPTDNPYTTSANTITLQGTVANADALYLSNGDASSSEEISIAADGTWQKPVLLQSGLNTFELAAKRLLGGETDDTLQIIYQAPALPSSTATSTASSSTITPVAAPSPTSF